MSELKLVSPLLDQMSVEEEIAGHNGCTCYALRHVQSGERFVVKRISVPASDLQVRALILSGAYPDDAAVHAYYGSVAEDIKNELDTGMRLAENGYFAGASSYQIEPKESGIGYDVYILYPRMVSLRAFLDHSAMTGLRAVNLGIDLCDALTACRDAGYLFENLKPENVFLTQSGRFLLGDLGLAPLEDLQYASVPENYLGPYSAPELSAITASPNPTIDLYAIGMLLYRIYNGNHGPFEDEATGEAMADKLRLTGKAMPTPIYADYELAAIILKTCAPRPEDRFQTPAELKQALVYYMQRNEVSDTLIVPPIVTPEAPLAPEAETDGEDAPARMTDAEQLDEKFRTSFAPDLSGAGTEKDIDPDAVPDAPKPEQKAEEKPQPPAEPEKPAEPVKEAEPVKDTEPEADEPAEETGSAEEAGPAPAEPEDEDPDQMDLDAFLASVNAAVGDVPPQTEEPEQEASPDEPDRPAEPEATYVDNDAESTLPPEPEKKPKKKRRAVTIGIVTALIVLLGAAAWFLLSYYFVRADALRVVRCTTEELTVALESGDKAADFRLTCSDMYGNSYPATAADGQYVFTGLSENTQYTITVTAADGHRLSSRGVSTLSVTTPEATEITDLTASLGDADGSVVLSFSANGPTPAQWTVSYAAGDGQKQSQQFTGNTVTVTGLTLQQNYTFTLEGTDTVFLTGTTTTEFTPIPVVKVDKLNVSSIEGNTVTVTWETGENIPAGWTVTCEARQFTTVTQTVTESSCVFELPDLKRDYTFTVSAEGMPAPAVLTLPANPLVVTGLQATANEDGTITASWQTASGAPVGGWYVTYGVPTSNHEPRLQECTENSVTLKGLIPDADYTISLTPADGADVFGTVEASAKTPSGGRFDRYGATPSTTYISLWETPAEVNWDYRSLTTSKTSFSADEDIALCLELTRKEDSDDEITLLYVIRNANGEPVSDASAQLTWDQMWHERRHTSTIPNPGAAGEYTLEVYVNRQLLKSIDFAIS